MPPTFLQKISKKGFTLLEVLIAVAIIVTSMVLITSQVGRSQNKIKDVFRELISIHRTLYDHSKIKNRIYRLAINTNQNQPSYWVEVKNKYYVQSEDEISLEETLSQTNPLFKDLDRPSYFIFEKDTSILEEEQILPSSFYFETIKDPDSLENQILYITYNPFLFSDKIEVALKKQAEEAFWILSFNPLYGELDISENNSLNQKQ